MVKRVLIVDDNAGFAENLRLNLEASNYTVRVETDGAQALSAARVFQPDIVLLDLVMPHLDGGSVAARLQQDATLTNVPIVFLTAMLPQDTDREIAGRSVMSKPVCYRDLVTSIEKHLARSQHPA